MLTTGLILLRIDPVLQDLLIGLIIVAVGFDQLRRRRVQICWTPLVNLGNLRPPGGRKSSKIQPLHGFVCWGDGAPGWKEFAVQNLVEDFAERYIVGTDPFRIEDLTLPLRGQ